MFMIVRTFSGLFTDLEITIYRFQDVSRFSMSVEPCLFIMRHSSDTRPEQTTVVVVVVVVVNFSDVFFLGVDLKPQLRVLFHLFWCHGR